MSDEVVTDLQEVTGREITTTDTAEARTPRSDKALLYLGHDIPERLGIDEDSRRALMEEITGKNSMKDMSPDEKELFVSTLEQQAEAAGIDHELPALEQIVDRLDEISKKKDGLTPTQELHKDNFKGTVQRVKEWTSKAYHEFIRMERIIEELDGEESGPLRENIWEPVKKADATRTNTVTARTEELVRWITEDYELDLGLLLGKVKEVAPGVELTGSERVGVYMLAQNENGKRYLNEGMSISDEVIAQVVESLGDNERAYGDKLLEEYHSQWPVIQQLAIQLDMDPEMLQEELQYSPILRKGIDPLEQVDFLDMLLDRFQQESFKPGQGFLEQRKERAVGKIELDATVIYLNNVRRVETFKAMAPVAKKVGKILRNKSFQKALNDATYDDGVRLFNTWFKDAVKGYSPIGNGWFARQLAILRRNGIVYAIGYNIPSSLRQTLSLSNAIAVNPRMMKNIPVNLGRAMTDFEALEKEVHDKSAMVRSRDFERDLRQKWDRESLRRKLGGKRKLSERATAWIRWMDRRTVVVAWKSLYDTADQLGMDEKAAIEYADKWVGRSQPMANAKDLPQFFRDGDLAKTLSTFQNQINNNFNFYSHDIIRARARGDISNTEVAYRVMFSWVLPAIAFGMIGRGGLPKTWKQLAVDLVTYPIASIMLLGRLINRAVLGWGNSSTIVEAAPEAAGQAIEAAKKGEYFDVIKNAAKAVAALRGYPAAQPIRTIEGAADLIAGETSDPRRLIWSEWALEQGEKTDRGRRRPQRKAPPRRRPR